MEKTLFTRRDWLSAAIAAPAALRAQGHADHADHNAISFVRDASPAVPARRDIATMRPDDPQLAMFRAAVQEMRRRSEKNKLDPLGWYQNAALHALFCATNDFQLQVHYCWLFLPWHRAYLAFLERKMRAVIGEPKLMLPYWDWSRHPAIPAHFFGAGNPLADGTRFQTPRDTMPPDFLDVAPALRAKTFSAFGGFSKKGPDDEQIEGLVEQGVHNNTHNWIGGNMAGFPSAGFDPMFGTHHGNVDRLWEAWLADGASHRNPDDPTWLDHTFHFHDERGRMIAIAIKDMLKPEWLGYRYDTLEFGMTARDRRPNMAAGELRNAILRFERAEVPIHPLCARLFVAAKGTPISFEPEAPEFAGTSTLLPVGDHKSGYLDRYVTMVIELDARQAETVQAAEAAVYLAPVSLRGRFIPATPVLLRTAQVRLLGE